MKLTLPNDQIIKQWHQTNYNIFYGAWDSDSLILIFRILDDLDEEDSFFILYSDGSFTIKDTAEDVELTASNIRPVLPGSKLEMILHYT